MTVDAEIQFDEFSMAIDTFKIEIAAMQEFLQSA